jgi:uncharacterized protein (DUF1778 family)
MTTASANLMVRLNPESKACISRAVALRGLSQSEYVRTIVLSQASAYQRAALLQPSTLHAAARARSAAVALVGVPAEGDRQRERHAVAGRRETRTAESEPGCA